MTDALPHLDQDVTVAGANAKHGLYSSQPIVRSLLSPGEAEAWDRAAIPVGTSSDVEEVMREYAVQRYRVHSWEHAHPMEIGGTDLHLKQLRTRLDLLHRPLRGALKAIEVQARIRESEGSASTSDAIVAYLRSLPAHRLGEVLLEGEAPRFHPESGELLALPAEVSRETPLPGATVGPANPVEDLPHSSGSPDEGDGDREEE